MQAGDGVGPVTEYLKFFAQAGIGATLAFLTFYFYRLDAKAHEARIAEIGRQHAERLDAVSQRYAEQLERIAVQASEDRRSLMAVIIENTRSNQQLISTTDALHRRLDSLQQVQQGNGHRDRG